MFFLRKAIEQCFQGSPSVSLFLLKQLYRLLLKQARELCNRCWTIKLRGTCFLLFKGKIGKKIKEFNNLIHWHTFNTSEIWPVLGVCKFLWKMSCVWQALWNLKLIKMLHAFSRPYATNCVGLEKYCLNVHLNTINKQFSLSIWINETLLISKHNLN